MTTQEWEALCDGCGKCCLHKIEDIDSGRVYYTNVACRLLDLETCRCKDYVHRMEKVKDCFVLTHKIVQEVNWLPETCAYRKIAEGESLEWWHPLISGDSKTVHQAGVSVCGRVISEEVIDPDDIEDMVVDWFD